MVHLSQRGKAYYCSSILRLKTRQTRAKNTAQNNARGQGRGTHAPFLEEREVRVGEQPEVGVELLERGPVGGLDGDGGQARTATDETCVDQKYQDWPILSTQDHSYSPCVARS